MRISDWSSDVCSSDLHHFHFNLGPREHGAAKPEASIFHAACARLQCAPGEVLHVGDHIEMDVLGAARAGLRSCWIDRESRDWPHEDIRPDLHFHTLAALADWLRSEEHTSELPSPMRISYAAFCLKQTTLTD